MAPSHYLEQYGLLIKLINKVPWHLYQWIIIKDLKIPISKMRLKLVLWDNFTSCPEIVNFILFSSDYSFVLCHGGKLIFIVTIFNPSDCCLLKGNKVPSPCVFCDHTTGGQCSKNVKQTCCMTSQSRGRLWPLLKLKLGNCWLTSKCCGSSCSTHICMVQCTHLITTGGTPHLYNRGSSMLVDILEKIICNFTNKLVYGFPSFKHPN